MRVTFNQTGLWQANNAATQWCKDHGISVGQSSATGPTGLMFGDWSWIAKWRNLTYKERQELHGTMGGDFREGPVVVILKDAAIEQFRPELLALNGAHLGATP